MGGGILAFLAPSLFSVYLIHTNVFGFSVITRLHVELADCHVPMVVSCICIAVLVFVVCCMIDIMRRLLLKPVTRW